VLGKLEIWTTTGDDGKTDGTTITGVDITIVKIEIVLTPPTAVLGKVDGNKATGTIATDVTDEITIIWVDGKVLGKFEIWTTTGDDGKTEGTTTTGVETITVTLGIAILEGSGSTDETGIEDGNTADEMITFPELKT